MNASTDSDDYTIQCVSGLPADDTCATTCVGVAACSSAQCPCVALSDDASGPWGAVMDVLCALFPVLFLIYVTIKRNPWPTTLSLPCAAVLLAWIRLAYFRSDPVLVGAAIIAGVGVYAHFCLCVFGGGRQWLWHARGAVGADARVDGPCSDGVGRVGTAVQYVCHRVGCRRDTHLVWSGSADRSGNGGRIVGRQSFGNFTKVRCISRNFGHDFDSIYSDHTRSAANRSRELDVCALVVTGNDRSQRSLGGGQL
jgi:hypothetical protein